MVCTRISNGIVCHSKKHKKGDLPPTGYNDWNDWAKVQYGAGLRQVVCGVCGRLGFPQEISDQTVTSVYSKTKNGPQISCQKPVCKQCCMVRDEKGKKVK